MRTRVVSYSCIIYGEVCRIAFKRKTFVKKISCLFFNVNNIQNVYIAHGSFSDIVLYNIENRITLDIYLLNGNKQLQNIINDTYLVLSRVK